jgi:hypothetical protein
MLKVTLNRAKVQVRGTWVRSGSVLAGNVKSTCTGVHTHLEIESGDDPALIAALVHSAHAGCYAEAALVERTPLDTVVTLNGEDFDYGRYSRRTPIGGR